MKKIENKSLLFQEKNKQTSHQFFCFLSNSIFYSFSFFFFSFRSLFYSFFFQFWMRDEEEKRRFQFKRWWWCQLKRVVLFLSLLAFLHLCSFFLFKVFFFYLKISEREINFFFLSLSLFAFLHLFFLNKKRRKREWGEKNDDF